jgi:PAS domain S-box-containing protein
MAGARRRSTRFPRRPKSDELLLRVMRAASEGMVVHCDGSIIEANQAFADMFGFADLSDAIGRDVFDLVAPESLTDIVDSTRSDEGAVEYRCRRIDGTRLVVESRAADITFRGTPARVVTATDVTRRQRDEIQLREAHERFRLAFDQAPIGMALVGTDGRFLHVNPALCDIVGYEADTLLLKTFQDITHPDDLETDVGLLYQVLAGHINNYSMEKRYLHAKGHVVWVNLAAALVRGSDGSPRYFISQIEDVTHRKRVEQALWHETATVRLLKGVAIAANEATHPDEAFARTIDAICAHTGWPVGHVYLRGEDPDRLVPSELWHLDDPSAFATFRALKEATSVARGEGLAGKVFEQGEAVWVRDFTPTLRRRGIPVTKLGVKAGFAFPVLVGTEMVAVLEFFSTTIAEPDDELLEVVANVGTQLGRVVERARLQEQQEALDVERGRFVANAAHELRTPLATLRTVAGLLGTRRDAMSPEEIDECCDLLERQGQHLDALVDDLLDLTRIEHGDPDTPPEEVPVTDWVTRALETAPPTAGATVATDIAPGLTVVGNPDRLDRVLVNLLTNAYHHGGSSISIVARRDGTATRLMVEDDGPGVPDGIVDQLFEPFTRSTSSGEKGNGLGLAIAEGIVSNLGGRIRYETGDAGGARFVLQLPVAS